MIGVLSLLVALTFSLIVTRVAAMALMFTGLSREAANFQARSAFSGVGYTTQEAENVVNHPVRRHIVMLLMLLGNVGIATVVATMIASMMITTGATPPQRVATLGALAFGLYVLWLGSRNRWVERRTNQLIAWSLQRFTDLDVRDYVSLLELSNGFAVTELLVEPGDWLNGRSLADLRLSDEGLLVLGIRPQQGKFQGSPRGDSMIHSGDTLILYGDLEDIKNLDCRRAGRSGDRDHRAAVEEQKQLLQATCTAAPPSEPPTVPGSEAVAP